MADGVQMLDERSRLVPTCRNRAYHGASMTLERGAWIATVLVALITAILVALEGYTGYAALSAAVGASAAINLL